MAGLDVLSALGLIGTSGSDFSSVRENGTSDKDLFGEFAEILGGWMFPADALKGQDSGEEKPGDQTNYPGWPEVLGLLDLSQMESLFQNYFPAGKEANSGGIVSQGKGIFDRIAKTGLIDQDPLAAALNLQQTGVTLPEFTGDSNPAAVELVKYKIIISKLLKELSGEIQALNSDSPGKSAAGFNSANLKAHNLLKIAEVIAGRAQILPLDNTRDLFREVIDQNPNDRGKVTDPVVLEPVVVQQGFNESNPKDKGSFRGTENREIGLLQVDFPDGAAKNEDKVPTDNPQDKLIPGFSALQDKVENVSSVPGRTTAPLWEQIAASIRRYATIQPGEIREFGLQLHPRELGKIYINLQWENGLVHINCQAAEALTAGILQQNLVQLRESLENNGITCGMMQMGLGGQQKHNRQNDEAKPYMKKSVPEAEEINSLARAVSYSASKLSDEHLINLTA